MNNISYSANSKEYLCEKTARETGFIKGGREKKISRCCERAFLCGALLYLKRHREKINVFTVDSSAFSELLTYLFIHTFHLTPEVKQEKVRGKTAFKVSVDNNEAQKVFPVLDGKKDLSDFIDCQDCVMYFLRGVFLACGTVSDPNASYHAEFITPSAESAEALFSFLIVENTEARVIKRGSSHIVYIKGRERVSDFFAKIGAQRFALDVIEKSIEKEIKNNLNRSCNCESANIRKTVSASLEIKNAIDKIKKRGVWNSLSQELRDAATLRLEYPDASLSELCLLNEGKALSRSGLNHRLQKIIKIAKELD